MLSSMFNIITIKYNTFMYKNTVFIIALRSMSIVFIFYNVFSIDIMTIFVGCSQSSLCSMVFINPPVSY